MTESSPPGPLVAFRRLLSRLWRDPFGRGLIISTSVSLLLLGGLIAFTLIYFRPSSPDGGGPPGATGGSTPRPPSSGQGGDGLFIQTGEISLSPSTPLNLTLGDEEPYALIPIFVKGDGELALPEGTEQELTAYWLYGTLVNFVVAFPNLANNAVALGSIREGDIVELGMEDGQTFEFRVIEKLRVAPTTTDVLAQNRPGLTLFLVGGAMTDRLVIRADFVSTERSPATSGDPGTLNEFRVVGDLEVLAEAIRTVNRPLEVPEGWSYLLVDYSLTNTGELDFSAASANQTLSDARGEEFSPVLQALNYSTRPALPAEVAAGQTVQASVGYLVPDSLAGPNLLWRFYPSAGGQEYAAFNLPYTTVMADLVVELTSALASADGRDLIVNGVIYNPSDVAATLTRTDLTLLADTGEVVAMRFSDPALPWNIGPQAAPQSFTVTFVHPAGGVASLHILDFVFEIRLNP